MPIIGYITIWDDSVRRCFHARMLLDVEQAHRQPLNIIPTWIVQMLKAKVSLDRIDIYLKEDEVSGQVSSLKKEIDLSSGGESTGLGLKNATLKWNMVEQDPESKDVQKNGAPDSTNGEGGSSGAFADDSSTVVSLDAEVSDHHFELRDISVIFPERKLSVITGPTARYDFLKSHI